MVALGMYSGQNDSTTQYRITFHNGTQCESCKNKALLWLKNIWSKEYLNPSEAIDMITLKKIETENTTPVALRRKTVEQIFGLRMSFKFSPNDSAIDSILRFPVASVELLEIEKTDIDACS